MSNIFRAKIYLDGYFTLSHGLEAGHTTAAKNHSYLSIFLHGIGIGIGIGSE